MTIDAPITDNSGPTTKFIKSSGIAKASPVSIVGTNTPLIALREPEIIATIKNGVMALRTKSWVEI